MKALVLVLFGIAGISGGTVLAADAIVLDLQKASQGVGVKFAEKVKVRWEADAKGRPALFATGVVWLEGVTFSEGTIECDILGKSAPRGSNFPGVVFHAADDTTYDCVYFRPFNFRAENPENARHAVQYVSPPTWTWQKLRREKTGQYEKPIAPAPDGDAWFRAKIVVQGKKVSVFVNGADQPSLVVDKLNDRTGGKIGITGGDAGEGGYFSNVKITPGKR